MMKESIEVCLKNDPEILYNIFELIYNFFSLVSEILPFSFDTPLPKSFPLLKALPESRVSSPASFPQYLQLCRIFRCSYYHEMLSARERQEKKA